MCDDCPDDVDLDRLPRAELAETQHGNMPAVVAAVLDQWLFEQHGVASSHHNVGAFLDALAADGYRVTRVEAPEFDQLIPPAVD